MRLSVCIPVFNPGPYLNEAIASVLAQSGVDFEVVIVDDASRPPVDLSFIQPVDPRIRLLRNERNLGLVGNWNRCLSLATGEHITIFHQDDVMSADSLAIRCDFLDHNPSAGFVHTDILTLDDTGRVVGGHWAAQPLPAGLSPGMLFYRHLFAGLNFVACPSVMIRSECLRQLGGFDPRLPFSCDMEMWLRIVSRYDAGYLDEPLVAVRRHSGQETARFAGRGREVVEVGRALRIALSEHSPKDESRELRRLGRRALARWAARMARWKLRTGHLLAALGYLRALAVVAATV